MPSYQRISSDDRWDIVNYIRYLNEPARFTQRVEGERGGIGQ